MQQVEFAVPVCELDVRRSPQKRATAPGEVGNLENLTLGQTVGVAFLLRRRDRLGESLPPPDHFQRLVAKFPFDKPAPVQDIGVRRDESAHHRLAEPYARVDDHTAGVARDRMYPERHTGDVGIDQGLDENRHRSIGRIQTMAHTVGASRPVRERCAAAKDRIPHKVNPVGRDAENRLVLSGKGCVRKVLGRGRGPDGDMGDAPAPEPVQGSGQRFAQALRQDGVRRVLSLGRLDQGGEGTGRQDESRRNGKPGPQETGQGLGLRADVVRPETLARFEPAKNGTPSLRRSAASGFRF